MEWNGYKLKELSCIKKPRHENKIQGKKKQIRCAEKYTHLNSTVFECKEGSSLTQFFRPHIMTYKMKEKKKFLIMLTEIMKETHQLKVAKVLIKMKYNKVKWTNKKKPPRF